MGLLPSRKIDPLTTRLFQIAFPIIIQNLVHYIQLQTDMALLGRYDAILLSAVGNVTFPYIVLVNFLLGLSTGATVMIAHAIGAKRIKPASRFSEVSFVYNSLISLPFFAILFLIPDLILSWMGTPAEVKGPGTIYMHILSWSLLFLGLEMSVTATLQGMGKTKHIMMAGILRTTVNVVLDWVLIYGHFGFPEMGIGGAATATSIANGMAALYLIASLKFSRSILFRPSIPGILRPRWWIQRLNIRIGIPTGFEAIMWSLGQIGIVRIVNEIDAMSAGLYLLVLRIQAVTFFFYLGIARGTMTLVGQKIGAGRPEEAVRVGMLGLRYAYMACILAAICFFTIPDKILSIFTSDQSIIESASPLLYLVAITIFPVTVNVVIGSGIRGMKDTKWMFYTQIIGTTFTIIVCAILVLVFEMGLYGVFLTAMADETIRAILNFVRFVKGRRGVKRIVGRPLKRMERWAWFGRGALNRE